MNKQLVLLYDGLCGFCDKTVQFLLRHDREGTIRFAPLQGAYGRELMSRHPHLREVDSLILVERPSEGSGEVLYSRSTAVLRLAAYLGGPWKLAMISAVVPLKIRDYAYDLFARHRYRLFGKHEQCPLPPPEVRSRFIGLEEG